MENSCNFVKQRKPRASTLWLFLYMCVLQLWYMDEDEDISSTDRYIYAEYSGLDVYGTAMDEDVDECEMPESMDDRD